LDARRAGLLASLVIGVVAVLGMRRSISGHRPAIAALILGGRREFLLAERRLMRLLERGICLGWSESTKVSASR